MRLRPQKPDSINIETKSLFLFLFLILIATDSKAQYSRGFVVDSSLTPLPFSTVVAYALPDTILIEGHICDSAGRFIIENPCDLIRASFVGYKTRWIASPKGNVGEIVLENETEMLNEINVVARKPIITSQPDRIVVTVQNSMLANTTDGIEMLRLTPGVMVDPLGEISVIGKGVPVIYINNRMIQSQTELESLNPQFIKSIDVIDEPSAKYDANANAVIKITTIKRDDFYNVRIGSTISKFSQWKERGFADLTFSKNKLSANLYYGINNNPTRPKENSRYYTHDDYLITSDYLKKEYHTLSHSLRGGIEYSISKKQSIGFQSSINLSFTESAYDKFVQNQDPNAFDFMVTQGAQKQNKSYIGTLYYNWDIDSKGQNLSVTLDYTHSEYDACDTFTNRPIQQEPINSILNHNSNFGAGNVLIGKIDYSLPVGDKIKLNAGSKISNITSNSKNRFNGYIDYENLYNSRETTTAVYLEAYLTISDRWSAIGGLRYENTDRSNIQNGTPTIHVQEGDIYPRVNILYKPAPSYSIRASYAKTVGRPSFSALNPSLSIDSLSNKIGNPELSNAFTHNFTLTANFPNDIGARATYSCTINPLIQLFQTNEDNPNILDGRYINGTPINKWSASAYANLNLTDWWYLYIETSFLQQNYTFMVDDITIVNADPGISGMVSTNFTLPHQWKISFTFEGFSRRSQATIVTDASCYLYAQVNKTMFNKALNFTLAFNDILGTDVSRQHNLLRGNLYNYFYGDAKGVSLVVTYKFGKSKKQVRYRSTGAEERERLQTE